MGVGLLLEGRERPPTTNTDRKQKSLGENVNSGKKKFKIKQAKKKKKKNQTVGKSYLGERVIGKKI